MNNDIINIIESIIKKGFSDQFHSGKLSRETGVDFIKSLGGNAEIVNYHTISEIAPETLQMYINALLLKQINELKYSEEVDGVTEFTGGNGDIIRIYGGPNE